MRVVPRIISKKVSWYSFCAADAGLRACIICDISKHYLQANDRTFVHFSLNLGLHTRESHLIVEVVRNAPDEVAAQAVA